MKLVYEGSVKNIYQDPQPGLLWFEFTDDYSVFDWGKMPDTIPGKGVALAKLARFFFEQLADPQAWKALGLEQSAAVRGVLPIRHHFLAQQGNRIQVQRVEVPKLKTAQVGGMLLYDYTFAPAARQLAPLEVIFRFGAPKGSSLLARKDWYPFEIYEGVAFEKPLVEFSTKLESKDRMVTYQEAALILKGETGLLDKIHRATAAVALFLQALFAKHGLKLWDGKLEWALVDGQPLLVDSIGPDELRVSLEETVFSKQFLRDYYLDGPWAKAVEQGKRMARDRGADDWKTIVVNELGQQPDPLSLPYRQAAQALYEDFQTILVEGKPSRRFVEAVSRLKKG